MPRRRGPPRHVQPVPGQRVAVAAHLRQRGRPRPARRCTTGPDLPTPPPRTEVRGLFNESPGTLVESVPAPIGKVAYEPVDTHAYLRQMLNSITVG
ncbi:hypothetical protein B1C81_39825 [Streptomyces sp. HG99]|nr:hypothetical protein B1C81_39825 [Streptomyces sp. HG99]